MSLKEQLQTDMKTAMRAKDQARLSVVRMMLAAIKQREIDERIDMTDEQILAVLEKQIKQRNDAAGQYDAAQREELAQKERDEIVVIQAYLPEPLSAAETAVLIQQAIAETGATDIKGMGQVMAYLKQHAAGRVDFSQISNTVRQHLTQ